MKRQMVAAKIDRGLCGAAKLHMLASSDLEIAGTRESPRRFEISILSAALGLEHRNTTRTTHYSLFRSNLSKHNGSLMHHMSHAIYRCTFSLDTNATTKTLNKWSRKDSARGIRGRQQNIALLAKLPKIVNIVVQAEPRPRSPAGQAKGSDGDVSKLLVPLVEEHQALLSHTAPNLFQRIHEVLQAHVTHLQRDACMPSHSGST